MHTLDSIHPDDVNVTRKRPLYSSTDYEERTLSSSEVRTIQQTTAVLPTPSPITPQPSTPKLTAPSLFPLTSTTSPLQTPTAPTTSHKQVSSMLPPPPSKIYERNSVHGYSTTSETEYSVNNVNKRRRKDDDLLDAFLEISDIMTWNQMQPITHAHIQNSPYETSANNKLVLPHQQHIDNSDEINNVDNIDDVYNVDNIDDVYKVDE